jgi:hypothetical protein
VGSDADRPDGAPLKHAAHAALAAPDIEGAPVAALRDALEKGGIENMLARPVAAFTDSRNPGRSRLVPAIAHV